MNGNTEIRLSIKQSASIMGMILAAGIWLGVNVMNTKDKVSELKVDIKELKMDIKSFNEKLTRITISVATLAANKQGNSTN